MSVTQDLYYSSTAVTMTLVTAIGPGDTTCQLSAAAGLPASTPFKLLIDWGAGSQEVVHCTALSGTTATISRAQDGTTAQSHAVAAVVVHGVSAKEFNDIELHKNSSQEVHGLAAGSSVVGTTDTQTLTNKTLTTPIINTATLNTPVLKGSGGTLTLPSGPDTLVGRGTTDTLTNKTLSNPTVNGGSLTSVTMDSASTWGGVAQSAVVTKTGSQTLTNKTLDPSCSIAGAMNEANAMFSGNGSPATAVFGSVTATTNSSGQISVSVFGAIEGVVANTGGSGAWVTTSWSGATATFTVWNSNGTINNSQRTVNYLLIAT